MQVTYHAFMIITWKVSYSLRLSLVFLDISTLICYSNLCSRLFDLDYFFAPGEV